MKNIKQIIKELLSEKNIVDVMKGRPRDELPWFHFTLGMYIRNKYLWRNSDNIKVLSDYYNEVDIDEISYKIIEELYNIINKK